MKKISEQGHPEEELIQISIQKGTLKTIPGITHPEERLIQISIRKETLKIIPGITDQEKKQIQTIPRNGKPKEQNTRTETILRPKKKMN